MKLCQTKGNSSFRKLENSPYSLSSGTFIDFWGNQPIFTALHYIFLYSYFNNRNHSIHGDAL